jgi:hypothetical protein
LLGKEKIAFPQFFLFKLDDIQTLAKLSYFKLFASPHNLVHDKFMRFLAFLLLIQFSLTAGARTIFEPSLSVNNGGFAGAIEGSDLLADGTQIEATYSSLSGGFRYGITRDYIHVTAAVDAYLFTSTTNREDVEMNTQFVTNVGLGIGYEWNIPMRTYVIIGFPFSSIELSYYLSEGFIVGLKATRMELEYAGADLAFNSYGLSVSFPIEFDYPTYWWRKRDWE